MASKPCFLMASKPGAFMVKEPQVVKEPQALCLVGFHCAWGSGAAFFALGHHDFRGICLKSV